MFNTNDVPSCGEDNASEIRILKHEMALLKSELSLLKQLHDNLQDDCNRLWRNEPY